MTDEPGAQRTPLQDTAADRQAAKRAAALTPQERELVAWFRRLGPDARRRLLALLAEDAEPAERTDRPPGA